MRDSCFAYDENLPVGQHLQASVDHSGQTVPPSILDGVSEISRSILVRFINDVCTNPDFLTNRLLSLSQQDLGFLLTSHTGTTSGRSVFGSRPPSLRGSQSALSRERTGPDPLEHFLDLSRHDPLSLLFELVATDDNGNPVPSGASRTTAWASICAKLLVDRKPGSDRFVISVLNEWARLSNWAGKQSLENWILRCLHDGSFLLEKPDKQSFRMRSQFRDAQDASDEAASEAFYGEAIKDLLSLLADQTAFGLIPDSVIHIGQEIVRQLHRFPTQCNAAPYFFVTRWLFPSFLTRAIVSPESCGLLLSHLIPENARQRILREIATRAQHMIFDVAYNWKHSVSVEATIAADVEKIVAGFKASSGGNAHQAEADREPGFNHALHKSCKPLPPMLCVADVVTLVDALYPEEKPQLFTPANLRGPQTPLSSASSVSGLSAFNDSGLGDMSSVSRPDTPRLQSEKEHGCLDPTSSLLRQACTELTGTIGPDAALGKVGPFLENWMPFPKPANATRTVQHRHRASENYPAADMSNPLKAGDLEADLADLDTDYLQMRSAVLGLVEEFAVLKVPIPSDGAHDAGPGQGTEETQSANPFQRYGGGTHHASSNPFRRRTYSGTYSPLSPATDWTAFGRPSSSGTHPSHADEVCDESLTSYMERAVEYYQREGSFTKACYYSQTLERIRHLSDSLTRGGCAPLVNQFTRDIKRSIERSQAVIEACEGLLTRLVPQQEQFDRIVEAISEDLHRLREKMWYAVDVRVAAQYEDLKGVVSALQTMCPPGRGQRPVAEGLPTARQRGAFKPSAQWAHLKTPAAVVTLDIMAVAPDYGGPNKLGNEQAQLTRSWMEKRGIENLCKGEERIHRFCLELNRCINNLISESPVKSPVLWSSELFQHERYQSSRSDRVDAPYGTAMPGLSERYSSYQATGRPGSRSSCGLGSSGRADPVPFALRHKRQSVFPIASTFQPPGMQDYFGSSSPTLTNKSSTEFWSPVSTEIQTPSSITSGSSRSLSPTLSIQMRAPSEVPVQNRYEFLTKLRESLTSLLISDLGNMMFPDGCETDVAMWDTLSGRFAQMISGKGVAGAAQGGQSASLDKNERQFGSREAESRDPQAVALDNRSYGGHENFTSHDQHERESKDIRAGVFNSEHASRRLIGTFAMACNPFAKLKMLHELQSILTFKSSSRTAPLPVVQTHNLDTPMTQPREEFKLHLRLDASGLRKASANTDTAVSAFRDIFRNPALRPRTLFRDMQYVASLVPMDILETSPEGKAFWNAAIAALSLKEEICRSMMELTDQIILYQTSNRGHSHTASAAQQQRDAATFTPTSSFPIQEDVSQYSMADAAQLLQITAKDGDPVAQRELATLYLTHPDLMNRVIAPMTRPQDVFKDTIERRWKDPDRYDPMTMCVAHHWMELSAKGGDALAAKYLKAKDEMERIP